MKRQVVLTVAESKRLIAKGVAALPEVQRAMKEGMVVVATGTTNAYVLEELWGRRIDKRRYRSGITTPGTPEKQKEPQEEPIPDVVFRKGEIAEDLDRYNAIEHMGKDDVYLKGVNALDYVGGVAGVLIGSPTGGTVGAVLGNVIGKKINLVIPVGLEKLVIDDINELHWIASQGDSEGQPVAHHRHHHHGDRGPGDHHRGRRLPIRRWRHSRGRGCCETVAGRRRGCRRFTPGSVGAGRVWRHDHQSQAQ